MPEIQFFAKIGRPQSTASHRHQLNLENTRNPGAEKRLSARDAQAHTRYAQLRLVMAYDLIAMIILRISGRLMAIRARV